MDLVICHPSLRYKGGAERLILEIAKRYNPVIYTADDGVENGYPEFREFDIRMIPAHPMEKAFFFFKDNGRVRISAHAGFRYFDYKIKEDYDVINAHVVPSEWIRNHNERVCWYCHSPVRAAFDLYERQMQELSFPGRILMNGVIEAYKYGEFAVLPKIEKICTNSEVSKNRISKYLGRNDAEVIITGLDAAKFYCEAYEKFFFYPSRIVPEKRFEYAIEAFRKFGRKGWKLVIGGALSSSRRDRDYFEKVKTAAKGANVEFALNMSNEHLKNLYSRCSAVLFAAIEEDFGLIPLESMASFKPCISVNEGGPAYTIKDGKTGFLVNSADEMAEKMLYLADHPDICEKMGKAGRHEIETNYTWKSCMNRLDKAFKETAKM